MSDARFALDRLKIAKFAMISGLFILPITNVPLQAEEAIQETDVGTSSAVCELHIWPSKGLRSAYYGWFHGGLVDGAVTGRDGYPPVPNNALGTDNQIEIIGKIDFSELNLSDPDTQIIVHNESLESRVIRKTEGRIDNSSAPCYAELIIEDIFFQQDAFSGKRLRTLFRYKDFESGDKLTFRYGSWFTSDLAAFPPANEAEVDAAILEITEAFTNTLKDFSGEVVSRRSDKK